MTDTEELPSAPPNPPRMLNPGYSRNYILRYETMGVGIISLILLIIIGAIYIFPRGVTGMNILYVILPMFLMIGLFKAVGSLLRELRILRRGDAVLGEVTKVFLYTFTGRKGYTPWVVTYRFLASGHEHVGNYYTRDNKIVDIVKEGQKVYVVYMQENPEQNALWPFWEDEILRE